VSTQHAELIEKAAFTLLALTRERDSLREENSLLNESTDRAQALEDIKPLVSQNEEPEEALSRYLENGGTYEGIKEARRLLPNIGEGFAPAGDAPGDGTDAMSEVNRLVLGEV